MTELESFLIRHLTKEEGFVPHCYEDHLGYKTIGIGRMIDKAKGGGITLDEAQYLLRNDIHWRTDDVRERLPFVKGMDMVRQAVLYAMAFQMGVDGLMEFRNTLKAVEEERWERAADGMLASLWARQTPGRANRLASAMRTGEARWLT